MGAECIAGGSLRREGEREDVEVDVDAPIVWWGVVWAWVLIRIWVSVWIEALVGICSRVIDWTW